MYHSQNNRSLHITTCPHQRPINITDHPINAVSPFAIAPDVAFSLHGQLETAFLLIRIILPIYTFHFFDRLSSFPLLCNEGIVHYYSCLYISLLVPTSVQRRYFDPV